MIEEVFDLEREDLFGAGKNRRIISAKEAFVLIGKHSGATVTEMSKFVGLDQSNTGRRRNAARQKCKTDPEFESTWKRVQDKFKQ